MASEETSSSSAPRVLIVEDEGIIARDIQKLLIKLGYQVAGPAGTASEALEAAESNPVDVVLMDIKIRGAIDGIETANEMRRRYRVPVVFLTAHADSTTLGRATQTQPYGYVVKPFTESSIKVAIEVALSRRRLEREAQSRQDWLYAALENIRDAVIATGGSDTVEYLNQTAEELTGWSAMHAKGRTLSEVLRLEIAGNNSDYEMLQAGRAIDNQIEFHNASICTRRGEKRDVVGSAGPLRISDASSNHGIVLVLRPASQAGGADATKDAGSREKLQELSYALTHDLREPVRNMTCFAQMLSRQTSMASLDPESQEYLRFIVEGSKRMDALLIGLFKYHAAGDRNADLKARTDATIAWTEAAASLSESVRLSGASIQVSDLPEVAMDAASLKDIFEALLSNALRFRSEEHPLIRAEARREGAYWQLTIADNGIGLESSQSERVLGLFKKAHRQGLSGAGIGLAVCRQLIERYGGRIWIESRPGQGARVHFTVPALKENSSQ